MEPRARPAGLRARLLLLPLLCWAAGPPATGPAAAAPTASPGATAAPTTSPGATAAPTTSPGATALQLDVTVLGDPSVPPAPGAGVTVSCRARGRPTLLYWLGNGSFVERLYPDGAVREGHVREEPGAVLRRDLHVGAWGARALSTNFTCVALSPCGHAARPARWPPTWAPAPG